MNKLNKILSVILVVTVLLGVVSVTTFALTGKTIVEFIDKYFVDDVEVSKVEYDSVVEASQVEPDVEYKQIINEHRFYTTNPSTEYVYNGQTLNQMLIEKESLIAINSGSLGDYLTFVLDESGNIIGAKVKSSKVIGATYKYTSGPCLSYCELNDGSYVYKQPSNLGYICCDKETMTFSMDSFSEEFILCDEDCTYVRTLNVGDNLFSFNNSNDYTNISFENVFEYIILMLSKEN